MKFPSHNPNIFDRVRVNSVLVAALMMYLSTHGYIPFLMRLDQSAGEKEGAVGLATQGLFLMVVAFLAVSYAGRLMKAAKFAKPLLAIAVFAILSTAWSQDPALTLRRSVMLLGPTVFALFIHVSTDHREQLDLMLFTGIAGMALSIAVALRFPAVGHDPTMADGSWQGIFPQKNVCARACVFALLPAIVFVGRSATRTLIVLTTLPLFAALLYKTNSKTGMVLAGIAVIATFTLRLFPRLRSHEAMVVTMLLTTGVVTGLILLESRFTELVQLLGKDSTLTGRTAIWEGAVEAITKHPVLGYGFAAFWMGLKGESANVVLAAHWLVPAAHNGFLDVWLQLGGVGVLLFLISLIQGCRAGVWCLRHVGREAAEWAAAVMLMTVLYNLDETSLLIPRELLWTLYCLAYLNLRVMMFEHKSAQTADRVRVVAVRIGRESSLSPALMSR